MLFYFIHFSYQNSIYKAVDENDNTAISITIEKGESLKSISKNLKEKDLIKSDFTFNIFSQKNELDKAILPGNHTLNKTMNVPEIIETLSRPPESIPLTILEGLTISQVDQRLSDDDLIKPGDFLNAVNNFNGWEYYNFLKPEYYDNLKVKLEGLIYPDTYFIKSENFNPESLIYKTLDNLEIKLNSKTKESGNITLLESIEKSDRSFMEIITMASIIEKEVRLKEDKFIVSGILWKRLDSDWLIGADATLLYITDDNNITYNELQIDNPYNTRKNSGLPPGPISNPSIESINAAIFPKETDYWFYLNTLDTGETIFSKTNEEHNQNKAKYL